MTATLDDVAKKKPAELSAEQQAAAELVRQAKERGLSLTGPDGLLKQLTKSVIEACGCRILHPPCSRCEPIFVNDAPEDLGPSQTHQFRLLNRQRGDAQALWCLLIEGAVPTMPVVMNEILGQDPLEMAATEDEELVQALSPSGANKAFRDRVGAWGLDRDLDDPGTVSAQDLVEAGGELAVSIADQDPGRRRPLGQDRAQVPSLLGDPVGAGNCFGRDGLGVCVGWQDVWSSYEDACLMAFRLLVRLSRGLLNLLVVRFLSASAEPFLTLCNSSRFRSDRIGRVLAGGCW
jgi:hypothetical protein